MKVQKLTVVSNRLPIVVDKDEEGNWILKPGSGGLVTALSPVLRDRGGSWIGWLGTGANDLIDISSMSDILSQGGSETGYELVPINLSEEEIHRYYYGFSNEVLWPLFHDFISRCNFRSDYWETYNTVNRKFADTIKPNTGENNFIWVHDYHLIPVAQFLRESGFKQRVAFFLHTPFPPLDIFIKLPWRFELLEVMLQYDLIGFQTMRDKKNFLGCIRSILRNVKISGGRRICQIITEHRKLLAGTFPISIDFREFEELAESPVVSR